MRRRKNKYQLVNIMLGLILFTVIVGVGYSYLNVSLKISGTVSGSTNNNEFVITNDSNKNLMISNLSINKWKDNNTYKYQYKITLRNIGNKNYDNYKITLNYNLNINVINIWNNEYEVKKNILKISNSNYILLPNKIVDIGFIVESKNQFLKINSIKLEIIEDNEEINKELFKVSFNKTGGWGNYTYQYDVTLTNLTGNVVNAWKLSITFPSGTNYVSGWNADFENIGNTLNITNKSYNGYIENNKMVSFGIQINTNIVNFIPTDIKITIR